MRSRPAVLLIAFLLGLPAPMGAAEAQQATNVPRVGFSRPAPPSPEAARILAAFKQGLREQGYVDGENAVVDVRFPKTTADSLPEIAAELARLKPSVIFAAASSGIGCRLKRDDGHSHRRPGPGDRSARQRDGREPRSSGRECHRDFS